jgi:phage-related minor tail protein
MGGGREGEGERGRDCALKQKRGVQGGFGIIATLKPANRRLGKLDIPGKRVSR